MWSELKELLVALIGALVVLWIVVTFTIRWSSPAKQDGGAAKKPKFREDVPREDLHSLVEDLDQGLESRVSNNLSNISKPTSARTMDGSPSVARLFIAPEASAPMREVDQVEAIARRGLRDDRYYEGCGFWSEKDECEVTMIAQEDLDDIERETGIGFDRGAHRRNIVTHNIALENLIGKRFQIGEAKFAYERPRPPCLHLQKLSEQDLVKALIGRSGICVRCFQGGTIRRGDSIVLIDLSFAAVVKKTIRSVGRQ